MIQSKHNLASVNKVARISHHFWRAYSLREHGEHCCSWFWYKILRIKCKTWEREVILCVYCSLKNMLSRLDFSMYILLNIFNIFIYSQKIVFKIPCKSKKNHKIHNCIFSQFFRFYTLTTAIISRLIWKLHIFFK